MDNAIYHARLPERYHLITQTLLHGADYVFMKLHARNVQPLYAEVGISVSSGWPSYPINDTINGTNPRSDLDFSEGL